MISVEEANVLIVKHSRPGAMQTRRMQDALGHHLAKDIRAPLDLPGADNSAMDGFVLRCQDTHAASPLNPVRIPVRGTIRAGDKTRPLREPVAYRIMTGACIPEGGDTILIKEYAVLAGEDLLFTAPLPMGRHIRRRGEEIRRGDAVLARHALIRPATVGLLSMLGMRQVRVFAKPRVALITTGEELVAPGKRLRPGQIYDSNSAMLSAMLRQMGLETTCVARVRDDAKALARAVRRGLRAGDMLLITGGVSVGEYDFVKQTLRDAGVREIFWRISQKPGKPLFFGKRAKTLVFGLPGNPASVLTCFYQYAYPALRRMAGSKEPYLQRVHASLAEAVQPDEKKFLFLKAKTLRNGKGQQVVALGRQGSHMLSSLHEADCFLRIPPGRHSVWAGKAVEVDMLPEGIR